MISNRHGPPLFDISVVATRYARISTIFAASRAGAPLVSNSVAGIY